MWRSLLFVPMLSEKLVAGAAKRGADTLVLDLEAAVPLDRKAEARVALPGVIASLKAQGARIAVRVNLLEEGGAEEISAAIAAGAGMIVLPHASATSTAQAAGIAGADIPMVALIETPAGVMDALEIANAAPNVKALALGVEDYSTNMGAEPTPDLLVHAGFQVIQAARAAGCVPLVVPDSIANVSDAPRFEAAARKGRAMGAAGGFAVHPMQVEALNRVFTPSSEDVVQARRIVQAADAARAQGQAVCLLDGEMIDAPIEARARGVLAMSDGLS